MSTPPTDPPYTALCLASGEKIKVKGDWEGLLEELPQAERHGSFITLTEHTNLGGHERVAVRISSIETVGPIGAHQWPLPPVSAVSTSIAACATGYVGSGVPG